ncbi:MAG TPA: glycine cleavage system protein H [Candidatus Solibacter sp.]|nr:glycine cleavage system protein H [Candidatus Solibacter sp.]
MTVILVLVMFAIFLTIDYMRQEKRVPAPVEARPEQAPAPRMLPRFVAGFELPENCRYHPGHTWAVQETPNLVRVGLDDFATRLLGKIDHIELPKRGQWVRQGQKLATVFRDGVKAELVSPIEGEVTQINEAVMGDTGLPGRDPYGQGWLVSVFSPDAKTSFRNLLGGTLARSWMTEAAARLFGKMPAQAGAVAQDGGLAVHDLTAELPDQKWGDVTKEFFLT